MNFDIRQGDALDRLREMPDESVNFCITSPPYFGLRDYGTAKWEGGDSGCSHARDAHSPDPKNPNCMSANGRGPASQALSRSFCAKCGARRIDQQIGLESTPEQYIARLAEVFHEVRRVLRDDGTCWINIGDSYAAQGGDHSIKPKDLIGIPWVLAFALRSDGWYLRQDIIWHKPNPMPESVKDRCTKAHEYIFLLSKSQRYWYDAGAIAEKIARGAAGSRFTDGKTADGKRGPSRIQQGPRRECESRNRRSVWSISSFPTPEAHFATFPIDLPELCLKAGCPVDGTVLDPFSGAGTTGLACLKNGRNYIGIELNPAYIEIAHQRARKYHPLLIEATV